MKNFQLKTKGDCFLIALLGYFLFTIVSCSGQDPQIITTESYSFYNSGNNQRGLAGQNLKDSLIVGYNGTIFNADSNKSVISVGLRAHFEVISGGGSVDQPDQVLPANGFVFTKWKIGTSTSAQLVTATIYDKSGNLLTHINFSAYAFQPGRWDVITSFPNGYLNDMVSDTIHHRTFMIFGATLYTEGDNYFQWDIVPGFENLSCHSIEMDKNGTIYIGTWDGNLYKSNDLAKTFTECTKPIPEYAGYYELMLTSDNTIWVSRFNYPLRFSNDGGKTWTLSESGLNNSSQSIDVFRFSTGKFITLSFDNISLLESTDGIHWVPVNNTPLNTSRMYVSEKDELIVLDVTLSAIIKTSVDYGKNFTQLYSGGVSYGTSPMYHIFSSYKGTNYISIPGEGILKTTDYNSFELIYDNIDIRGLMVDHNGVFFATNKGFNKVYCYNAD
jgi:hypothetical protein